MPGAAGVTAARRELKRYRGLPRPPAWFSKLRRKVARDVGKIPYPVKMEYVRLREKSQLGRARWFCDGVHQPKVIISLHKGLKGRYYYGSAGVLESRESIAAHELAEVARGLRGKAGEMFARRYQKKFALKASGKYASRSGISAKVKKKKKTKKRKS